MDAFQGCYKDGTNGTKDCRWYVAVHLWARITFFAISAIVLSELWLPFVAFGVLIMLILVTVSHPYKSPTFNTVESSLFLQWFLYLCQAWHMLYHTQKHISSR